MKAILALDPAAKCGFAHSSGRRGVWHLGDMDGFRQLNLLREILDAAKAWGCEEIAFEDASFGAINRNTQAFHNELRGVIKLAAAELQIPTRVYHPTSIKAFATNCGHASKDQMIRACKTILGIEPSSDDEADAIWILEMAKQGYKPSPSKKKPKPKARRRREQRLF